MSAPSSPPRGAPYQQHPPYNEQIHQQPFSGPVSPSYSPHYHSPVAQPRPLQPHYSPYASSYVSPASPVPVPVPVHPPGAPFLAYAPAPATAHLPYGAPVGYPPAVSNLSSSPFLHSSSDAVQQTGALFPHHSVTALCPHCSTTGSTEVKRVSGTLTWLACSGLCLAGCAMFCCLLPFFFPSTRDTEHWCASCHRLIARRQQVDC